MVTRKLKLRCPSDKVKSLTHLTPQFTFFPMYPLSSPPRGGGRSSCLMEVKDPGVGARGRCGDQGTLLRGDET